MSYSAVSSVRRGSRSLIRDLLRQSNPGDDAIIGAVRRGLPSSALEELLGAGLTEGEIAGVIGFSVRTLHRKRDRAVRLDVAEGDRAVRLARTLADADRYIGDRGRALRWLRSKVWTLGDRTPLELLSTEAGTEMIRQALATIAYGGVA